MDLAREKGKTGSTVELFGVEIALGSRDSFLQLFIAAALRRENFFVCFVNVHQLMECEDNQALAKANSRARYSLPDGAPVALCAGLLSRSRQERIDGPGFVENLLFRLSDTELTVRFIGGGEWTRAKLEEVCREKYPKLHLKAPIVPGFVSIDGDSNIHGDQEFLDLLRKEPSDFTFVCLGCPKQEIWMLERTLELPGIFLGVGAAIDFLSGEKVRAPYVMRYLGLEWVFRLCQEPRRLFSRYWSTNLRFLAKVFSKRFLTAIVKNKYFKDH